MNRINSLNFNISIATVIIILGLIMVAFGSCFAVKSNSKAKPLPILAFSSDRNGAGDIFVMTANGQIVNLTNNSEADWNPAWSPDGTMLSFTSHRNNSSDIGLLDITQLDNGNRIRNLTNNPAWDYSPTWSHTGQSIAFVSERDGDPEIFIQNIAEDTAIQLTFNEEMDRIPAWSPDGKHIAFAGVRGGTERIFIIRPDGTDEQLITPQIQGTSPAWSPDSERLAFIGWNNENKAGIYIIGPEQKDLELIYQSDSWLGSVDWSADGNWITFTSWKTGNHELYAIPAKGGEPITVTVNPAWDDFLVINPKADFMPSRGRQGVIKTVNPTSNPDFATGVNIADLGLAYLVNDMGFDWAKGFVNWGTVEPEQGRLRWVDPDNIVKAFSDQKVKILMRVHGTPEWARPSNTNLSHPPKDMSDFSNFMTALATRYKGQVAAYEIWNEPNLNYEWGYLEPDPAEYTKMLKAAYTAIKAVDPEAIVVSGGLSTTGEGSAGAYGDLAYLQGMYDAGVKGYFDALGSHPYAYGQAPDVVHPDGLSFSRVEQQYQLMKDNGNSDSPIWITEMGWVLQTSWNLGEHQTIGVTEAEQAKYLLRAYDKVQEEWPFVEAVFLFNLDFSTVSWYPAQEPMRWYAILNPDRTPRPAYTTVRKDKRKD